MKNSNTRNLTGIVIACMVMAACGNPKSEHSKAKIPEIPQALQENKKEVRSYHKTGDLISELYEELLDQNSELKELEEDIERINGQSGKLSAKVNDYDNKSEDYYSTASIALSSVNDSALKKRMNEMIEKSNAKYKARTIEINSLLKQIANKEVSMRDHHTVLKILLTLPMIEKYQDISQPDKKEFRTLMQQQEEWIRRAKQLSK